VRALGIDFGLRRIGLALSDVTGTLASPLPTLVYRAGKRPPLPEVERIARANDVEALVLGLPLDLKGRETELCATVRQFGGVLSARLGVPAEFIDERFSSVQAQEAIRASGLRKRQRERKDRIDAAAAAFILQAWLDRRRRP
jgi:putative Holliday junction resolvase